MPAPQPARREGDTVPEVSLRMLVDDQWQTVDTAELFAGKTVVLFSLPGAFTPTCSSNHLPRYNELAPQFRAAGVDLIVCLSVNDPYVMAQWGKEQEADQLLLLPDGNAEFTRQMGMLVDKADLNFGQRSWRYAMLVRDKRIEALFVEPDKPGDPFEVSDADTMLEHIAPGSGRPERVALLTRPGCPHCARAKAALQAAGIAYAEVPLDPAIRSQVLGAVAGASTVPQVFIDGRCIGGADELEHYLAERHAPPGSAAGDKPTAVPQGGPGQAQAAPTQ